MSNPPIVPYQEGDFIREPTGIAGGFREVAFIGPIYRLHYPPQCDEIQEMMDWMGIGYRMPSASTYDSSKGFDLMLMGDIPEWFQDRLRGAGVKIDLQKPRGPRADPVCAGF
jgi:hypothetical protein